MSNIYIFIDGATLQSHIKVIRGAISASYVTTERHATYRDTQSNRKHTANHQIYPEPHRQQSRLCHVTRYVTSSSTSNVSAHRQ